MNKSYLLDSHTLLWFLAGEKNLSDKAKTIILKSENACFISIASLWEIAVKISLGKLKLGVEFRKFAQLLDENDIEILQITFDHVLELGKLEFIHRDPFDRIIISQSKHENLFLITKDRIFREYADLNVVW